MATPGSFGSRCRRWMIYSPIVEIIGAGAMHSALSVSEHVFQSRIGADHDKMKTMKPEDASRATLRVAASDSAARLRGERRHRVGFSARLRRQVPLSARTIHEGKGT
ncbi:hypothetical protein [Burkholderia cepacia]|uniref:hypothetical protein n=1 Tax=Burkholderia cepacia TaxID=292 RepID=UPI000F5FE662|nr:hypothetical protein [Burkholderia cepacia]